MGYHPHASESPFKWHFAGVLMMAQHAGLVALRFFRGSGPVLQSVIISTFYRGEIANTKSNKELDSFSSFNIK